jgi:hypothetical protein
MMKDNRPVLRGASHDVLELKDNYGRKRSILRKLMIAQRRKFNLKKEILDANRIKKQIVDTSISNMSEMSDDEQKNKNMK